MDPFDIGEIIQVFLHQCGDSHEDVGLFQS